MENRIQEILDQKGWTQTKLEEETGIDQGELSKIINKKKKRLSLPVAQKISRALGYSTDHVFPYPDSK
jgi:transcriptional regulator with XRE-family HTH domain